MEWQNRSIKKRTGIICVFYRFHGFPWNRLVSWITPKERGEKRGLGERNLRFLLSYFSVFLFPVIRFSVGICGSREYGIGWPMQNGTIPFPAGPAKEALIKSLSDFILGFLCNARNNSTRIASYLRQQSCIGLLSQDKLIGLPFILGRVMTKQCIKILMKSDSAN